MGETQGIRVVARNRKARHEYEVLEEHEAGLVLRGAEVKSLRAGQVSFADAFARVDDGELWLHHLHITPKARCILCCQDYSETTEIGDLNRNSVHEVLIGDAFARARRQVYGLEEAPDDFICHNCHFALRR